MIPNDLLPPGTRAFIAGGYAACPALATDMDVWVQVYSEGEIEPMRARLLDHFRTSAIPYTEETGTNENYGLDTRRTVTAKCAKVYRRIPIHVLVTTGGVAAVLDSFDISTHMVALTPWGVQRGADYTPITETPRVLRQTPTTPARLLKICTRYGLTVPSSLEVPVAEIVR